MELRQLVLTLTCQLKSTKTILSLVYLLGSFGNIVIYNVKSNSVVGCSQNGIKIRLVNIETIFK